MALSEEEIEKIVERVWLRVLKNKSYIALELWKTMNDNEKLSILRDIVRDLKDLQINDKSKG
jgi:hypothetical protein